MCFFDGVSDRCEGYFNYATQKLVRPSALYFIQGEYVFPRGFNPIGHLAADLLMFSPLYKRVRVPADVD